MDFFSIILITCIIVLLFYIFLKRHFSYWERIGLDYLEPRLFFGNTKSICDGVSMSDTFANIYKEMKSRGYKHGGCYFFFKPIYIPIDLDIIKNIMLTDFEYFFNHGIYHNEEGEPMTAHLFSLENEKWRNLRKRLTPTFTSGKLKMMYSTLFSCSNKLKEVLDQYAAIQDPVDIKDLMSRFTIEVIGSVAFGLNTNSITDTNSEFMQIANKIFDSGPFWERCKEIAIFMLPQNFLKAIKFKFAHREVEDFFYNMVKRTVEYRETKNVFRKDFMHLLLQLKNRGKISEDNLITRQEGEEKGPDSITIDEMVAQCFIFFAAGFETSATSLTFSLLELAINQDIQNRLRDEILFTMEKNNGQLTYDAIMSMNYLEQVVSEALRKHSPGPLLPRVCTKNYKVPGTNVVIEKGTRVIIPAIAIHNDPEIYPNPDVFDPERFNEDNKAKRKSCSYLAFGEGPRYCIGFRFGMMQVKVGLAVILSNFRVNVHEKTQLPIKYAYTNAFILGVDGGVWLSVSRL
ncbi:cytochrome P450 6a2-like [Diorhabda carinulata]|uniref:cytochrome P450 6a2-like n=1 Tax=Diorhabda carinulata TaxID=1163345 RepID=UPI00259FED92|nr:cytochrome P450 6a2-like [Diorhabda carinulata]